jgi:hypothetical protein
VLACESVDCLIKSVRLSSDERARKNELCLLSSD